VAASHVEDGAANRPVNVAQRCIFHCARVPVNKRGVVFIRLAIERPLRQIVLLIAFHGFKHIQTLRVALRFRR